MKKFSGVVPPVITIFDRSGKIDMEANRRHLDFLIAHGIHGAAYLGTTGEFGSLTLQEKKDFLREMSIHCAGRIPILAGVSDTCLPNVIELAQYCETIGIDGLLLLPPYFSIYPDEMTTAFFDAVVAATKLPIVLYNYPALTGFEMSPEWVTALAKRHPSIIGIKGTLGDVEKVTSMMVVKDVRSDFLVYAAYDNHFLEARLCGLDGFIPASANCFPEISVALWDNPDEEHYAKVMSAMRIYRQTKPLFLGVKEAVYQREGIENHSERLPACEATPEQKQAIAELLKEIIH